MNLCPFCAAEVETKGPCSAQKCQEASSRVATAPVLRGGIPIIRKGYRNSQPENERVRQKTNFRLLPAVVRDFAELARRRGCPASSLVESLMLGELAADKAEKA